MRECRAAFAHSLFVAVASVRDSVYTPDGL